MLRSRYSWLMLVVLALIAFARGTAHAQNHPKAASNVASKSEPPSEPLPQRLHRGFEIVGDWTANQLNNVAEKASRLQEAIQSIGGTSEPPCPPDLPPAVKIKPPTPEIVKPKIFKDEGELIRYITCYDDPTKPEYTENFKKFLPMINLAAREFGVSPTMLTCLLFRESKFDPNAVSETGAVGLGQFLSGTTNTISNLIASAKMSQKEVDRLHSVFQVPAPELPKKLAANSSQMSEYKRRLRRWESERMYASVRLSNRGFGMLWFQYLSSLRSQKIAPKQKDVRAFDVSAARTPALAIGAAALYVRYLHDMMAQNIDVEPDDSLSPQALADHEVQLQIAVAGIYNLGEGTAINAMKRAKKQNPMGWRASIASVESNGRLEAKGHMDSIERCVTNRSSNPKLAFEPMNGTGRRDCFPEESTQANAEQSKLIEVSIDPNAKLDKSRKAKP